MRTIAPETPVPPEQSAPVFVQTVPATDLNVPVADGWKFWLVALAPEMVTDASGCWPYPGMYAATFHVPFPTYKLYAPDESVCASAWPFGPKQAFPAVPGSQYAHTCAPCIAFVPSVTEPPMEVVGLLILIVTALEDAEAPFTNKLPALSTSTDISWLDGNPGAFAPIL